ncbi:MAG: hypothetical protein WC378_00870 [Opitutaceae bacterium]|jgi:predicted PurR-regulated permease PerM
MGSIISWFSSPVLSGVFGGLFGLLTGVLQLVQKRDEAKLKIAEWAHDLELTKLQGNISQANLAGTIALTREKGASDAFTASVDSDAKIKGESRAFTNLRVSVRPVLTYLYQFALLCIVTFALLAWWQKWCDETRLLPILEYTVTAIVNLATMTLSWWFGQRQIEKSSITWGNSTVGASVQSKNNPTTTVKNF